MAMENTAVRRGMLPAQRSARPYDHHTFHYGTETAARETTIAKEHNASDDTSLATLRRATARMDYTLWYVGEAQKKRLQCRYRGTHMRHQTGTGRVFSIQCSRRSYHAPSPQLAFENEQYPWVLFLLLQALLHKQAHRCCYPSFLPIQEK
ncbi:hypothetical protein BJX64DRAFT_262544 [Aspergillus heterothallicus]